MEKYGSKPEHYAWIGWKNHKHSVNNPYAQFQTEYSLEDIKDAPMIHEPLTKLQCSPTSDGAGAVIVASERFVDEHDLWDQAIEIAGQAMVTDLGSTFDENADCIKIVGYDMSKKAARPRLRGGPGRPRGRAGRRAARLLQRERADHLRGARVRRPRARATSWSSKQATTYGGDGPVVNPSGGLISKGHPLGATGLAQCSELNWQLRGEADKRQVDNVKVALQHNIGLGGAAVVSIYRKAA